jgi:hypothetical protein
LADGTKDVKKKKKGIGTFGFFGPEIAQANSHIAVGLEPASEEPASETVEGVRHRSTRLTHRTHDQPIVRSLYPGIDTALSSLHRGRDSFERRRRR